MSDYTPRSWGPYGRARRNGDNPNQQGGPSRQSNGNLVGDVANQLQGMMQGVMQEIQQSHAPGDTHSFSLDFGGTQGGPPQSYGQPRGGGYRPEYPPQGGFQPSNGYGASPPGASPYGGYRQREPQYPSQPQGGFQPTRNGGAPRIRTATESRQRDDIIREYMHQNPGANRLTVEMAFDHDTGTVGSNDVRQLTEEQRREREQTIQDYMAEHPGTPRSIVEQAMELNLRRAQGATGGFEGFIQSSRPSRRGGPSAVNVEFDDEGPPRRQPFREQMLPDSGYGYNQPPLSNRGNPADIARARESVIRNFLRTNPGASLQEAEQAYQELLRNGGI
ncbi:hypothetical protein G7Y89_g3658 [Cudoniella acicularis]|uniref:Uncharacterized protein n=1 Tax=Cudoniella acicularis TaxID=354080 RepID=A0A8H4RS95_9HELO|nr:hypothetical protein G7Y89_g3658 [Cudoniella acicularis]